MLMIRDPRKTWIQPIETAAARRGVPTKVIHNESDLVDDGLLFIRPHAHPGVLKQDQALYDRTTKRIQDHLQVRYYEDKRGQYSEWCEWMPMTWVTEDVELALLWAETLPLPIVSKADVGASSYNVRVFFERADLVSHVREIFLGEGVRVKHCDSQGTESMQRGYVLLQEFIEHDTTYRVNRVGDEYAIWLRHNYPDRPVAMTGNTDFVRELTPELESLLEFSAEFTESHSRWICLDILKHGDKWKLLETSLCWPWPGVDGSLWFPSGREWAAQFDIMMEYWADQL